jgi:deazaflavin-dependent oxidoreductase (nitroreductase family)
MAWFLRWPSGCCGVRWLVRAPIWLYRGGLGIVFGSRLLMLEHTGRTAGARRYAVLEVIDRPSPGRYVVSSGFGARTQWFRNVQANPHVRVYLGSRRPVPATARLLTPSQAASAPRNGWGDAQAGPGDHPRHPDKRAACQTALGLPRSHPWTSPSA